MPEGAILATRFYTPERFSMTAGVSVPLDGVVVRNLVAELPRHLGDLEPNRLVEDRRFAELVYRVALADGITERVAFQDLPPAS